MTVRPSWERIHNPPLRVPVAVIPMSTTDSTTCSQVIARASGPVNEWRRARREAEPWASICEIGSAAATSRSIAGAKRRAIVPSSCFSSSVKTRGPEKRSPTMPRVRSPEKIGRQAVALSANWRWVRLSSG